MTTWQAMNQLERLGYQFEATADGVRVTLQGEAPREASALLEIARRDREAARAYVMERQAGAHVAEDGSTYCKFPSSIRLRQLKMLSDFLAIMRARAGEPEPHNR